MYIYIYIYAYTSTYIHIYTYAHIPDCGTDVPRKRVAVWMLVASFSEQLETKS